MAARRKPTNGYQPDKEPEGTVLNPPTGGSGIQKPEHIEVKESTIHTLVIPERMYERMRSVGNDEYWLRIIDSHIEIMMTRYHQ